MFNESQKQELLNLARTAIKAKFSKEDIKYPNDPAYDVKMGVFVSLHKSDELRGCIGYIKGYKTLLPSIIELARSAAFHDPRFSPVREIELDDIVIEISILSDMIPVLDISEIVIGRDGLLLNHPYGSGLLLPQVPIQFQWDLAVYLKHICLKSGVPVGGWKDAKANLYRFTAEIFSESKKNSD